MQNIVVNKATKHVLYGVQLEDYAEEDWFHNPCISGVSEISHNYWNFDEEIGCFTEMSEEDKLIADEELLLVYKEKILNDLWNSCYAYQNEFFNEPMWTKIMQMQLMGDTRANEIDNWVNGLWNNYYTRRYYINHANAIAAIDAISLDFSDYGEPPYRVYEILDVTL